MGNLNFNCWHNQMMRYCQPLEANTAEINRMPDPENQRQWIVNNVLLSKLENSKPILQWLNILIQVLQTLIGQSECDTVTARF